MSQPDLRVHFEVHTPDVPDERINDELVQQIRTLNDRYVKDVKFYVEKAWRRFLAETTTTD